MDVFLQILEGNGHKRTQRESLCTGTAKSEPRQDIYLEQTTVYRYIVAALIISIWIICFLNKLLFEDDIILMFKTKLKF